MKGALAGLALLASMAIAVPVDIESRSIADDVFSKLVLYSQWSAAAYCMNNNDAPGNKVTCPVGNCPLVEAADTVTTTDFENTLITDDTGFVAVDKTDEVIVLAFRGSQSIPNFIDDVEFNQVPWDRCDGCLVHAGFWTAWLEIRSTVTQAIASAVAQNPDYQVIITGHSLGGAIAAIAAAEFRAAGTPATLYTYGQPRIGNIPLSDYITNQEGGNFRVTHTDDPVPRLPPILSDYVHISPEYHIEEGYDDITPNEMTVYQGDINFAGNTGTVGLNVIDHIHYFGPIGACGPICIAIPCP
ncbi:MAG: hypothetical protein M1838_000153 [Thelocarpon superellum]|nr:MAG: hypothetical protein M1838_000153 [Thelocarpon superellum]